MLAATCLALNVYFESRSEASVLSQFAVAQVTMNRVMSDKYPNSICDVVWQKGQFSWTHDGKSDKPYEKQAWDRAQWVAKVTLDNPKKAWDYCRQTRCIITQTMSNPFGQSQNL